MASGRGRIEVHRLCDLRKCLRPGAPLLAHSEACEVQAFETASAIGLRFHLEMASPGLEELSRNCDSEIGAGPNEQSPEVLRAGESAYGEAARHMLCRLLDSILARVAAARR